MAVLKNKTQGGMKMTRRELAELMQKSSVDCHKALVKEYGRYVYAIVYNKLRCCGTNEDIEECVSDVFADVFMKYQFNALPVVDLYNHLKGIVTWDDAQDVVEEEKEVSNPQELAEMKKLQKKLSAYQSVSFTTNLLMNSNLLLYTSYINTTSDFNSIMEKIYSLSA